MLSDDSGIRIDLLALYAFRWVPKDGYPHCNTNCNWEQNIPKLAFWFEVNAQGPVLQVPHFNRVIALRNRS